MLAALAQTEHRPALAVTRPARPRGRGRRPADPPVATPARELAIELIQPESVNTPEAFERISAARPEALCVCAYGALVKEPLLSAWPTFNVHPSLLPRWRGAAPIERAIAAGDAETGVSIMALTAELDAGPVCMQEREPIAHDDDFGTLSERLAVRASRMLVAALDAAQSGAIQWREQPTIGDRSITYAEKIERADRRLDPTSEPAVKLASMVRALTPHVGAFLELADGAGLVVERASVTDSDVPPAAGEVRVNDGRLLVGTVDGTLELLTVRPAGKRSMDAASFLRGNPVPTLAPAGEL